jgi:myo-inositol 2-dehydrogenase / D-chiro-inositol 1-dehydrogenase
MVGSQRLRLGMIGAGYIARLHLPALARLDRTELVGVVSRSPESAAAITARWGGAPYTDPRRMLDEQLPDVCYVCLPPNRSAAVCELVIERGIPFLTEKPLAADAAEPERIKALLEGRNLVAAVGYNWRGIDFLPEVKTALAEHPARLFLARWTGDVPGPAWWRHRAESGGQVVEQATHLYDLGRHLLGEATVEAAAMARDPRPAYPDLDIDDLATAILRFDSGAVGTIVSSSLLPTGVVEAELIGDRFRMTIRHISGESGPRWTLTTEDGRQPRVIDTRRDSYEVQAEAFLDAIAEGDPSRVRSSYEDAVRTDRLTRSVLAAASSTG